MFTQRFFSILKKIYFFYQIYVEYDLLLNSWKQKARRYNINVRKVFSCRKKSFNSAYERLQTDIRLTKTLNSIWQHRQGASPKSLCCMWLLLQKIASYSAVHVSVPVVLYVLAPRIPGNASEIIPALQKCNIGWSGPPHLWSHTIKQVIHRTGDQDFDGQWKFDVICSNLGCDLPGDISVPAWGPAINKVLD